MESVAHDLLLMLGTTLVSLFSAWVKKKLDLKALKEGTKTLDTV